MTACYGHTIFRRARCLHTSHSKIHGYRRAHLKIIKVTWSWEPTTLRSVSVILTCYGWHEEGRLRLKRDGTRAETRFRLSAKRTSPFIWAGAAVQSTTGSRGVRISDSDAEYTKFRGSVKGNGYPLHSPVSPSLLLPCVVCHHVSTGLYNIPSIAVWHHPVQQVRGYKIWVL